MWSLALRSPNMLGVKVTVNVVLSLFGGWKRAPAFFETVGRAWSELVPNTD